MSGRKKPPVIQYLNTDLILIVTRDIAPLARQLTEHGLFTLDDPYLGDNGKTWHASFETDADAEPDEPDATIRMMLNAIEALDGKAKKLWDKCSLREFNIGYDCGDEPWAFNNGLSDATVKRMAGVKASLRITLYPDRPPAKKKPTAIVDHDCQRPSIESAGFALSTVADAG